MIFGRYRGLVSTVRQWCKRVHGLEKRIARLAYSQEDSELLTWAQLQKLEAKVQAIESRQFLTLKEIQSEVKSATIGIRRDVDNIYKMPTLPATVAEKLKSLDSGLRELKEQWSNYAENNKRHVVYLPHCHGQGSCLACRAGDVPPQESSDEG